MNKKSDPVLALEKAWEERWEGVDDTAKITALGRLMFQSKLAAMKKAIPPLGAKTAIDVGCALGYTLTTLQDMGLECIGIDIAQSAIDACVRKNLPVELKNVQQIEKTYDLVFSDGMLEHFLNFEPFVSHFCRISNKYVVLVQPNHSSFVGKSAVYFAVLIRGEDNIFEFNYRISDFIVMFENYEFTLRLNQSIFMDVFRLLVFEKQ